MSHFELLGTKTLEYLGGVINPVTEYKDAKMFPTQIFLCGMKAWL